MIVRESITLGLRRLEEIAMRPASAQHTMNYIEMKIQIEKDEAKAGWIDRVKILEGEREM